ncbi:hypothetical protein [Rhodococcus pyridinivorans]|uniref:hypothetical protein n=1 Tax=Rhodococcus pyridinivorans TaxID=103816 RepID=UPI00228423A9|nr:hypothetical protein [Rhodococcus pyridinivorans]WAL46981.1 hypothetical protein OQN32_02455 [Rhodococcus pyridinivorans]
MSVDDADHRTVASIAETDCVRRLFENFFEIRHDERIAGRSARAGPADAGSRTVAQRLGNPRAIGCRSRAVCPSQK